MFIFLIQYVTIIHRSACTGKTDTGAPPGNSEGDSKMEDKRTDEKMLDESVHKGRIIRAAHYDKLTGLPNLAYFFKLAESARDALLSEGKEMALLYMDLNGMKNFNFRHGFAEGDKLLLAFAEVLKKNFGWEKCCHIGADRFTAFTPTEDLEKKVTEFLRDASAVNG